MACAHESSGVPEAWAAGAERSGPYLLDDLSELTARDLASSISQARQPGDVAVVSIHWGSNWGDEVPGRFKAFAHALVEAGVNVVHGHSSHHFRPIEIYRDRLIVYGCGDFVNDYEGIGGYEEFRPEMALLYLATVDRATGRLEMLEVVPFRRRRFRLERAGEAELAWVRARLSMAGERRVDVRGGMIAP